MHRGTEGEKISEWHRRVGQLEKACIKEIQAAKGC